MSVFRESYLGEWIINCPNILNKLVSRVFDMLCSRMTKIALHPITLKVVILVITLNTGQVSELSPSFLSLSLCLSSFIALPNLSLQLFLEISGFGLSFSPLIYLGFWKFWSWIREWLKLLKNGTSRCPSSLARISQLQLSQPWDAHLRYRFTID